MKRRCLFQGGKIHTYKGLYSRRAQDERTTILKYLWHLSTNNSRHKSRRKSTRFLTATSRQGATVTSCALRVPEVITLTAITNLQSISSCKNICNMALVTLVPTQNRYNPGAYKLNCRKKRAPAANHKQCD